MAPWSKKKNKQPTGSAKPVASASEYKSLLHNGAPSQAPKTLYSSNVVSDFVEGVVMTPQDPEDEEEEDLTRSDASDPFLLNPNDHSMRSPFMEAILESGAWVGSKFSPGSIKGSVFTLTTTIIGAGTLSIPYAMNSSGIVLGMLMLFCGALMAYLSLVMLSVCADYTGKVSYKEVVVAAFGNKASTFVQFMLCANLFGSSIAYIVGNGTLIPVVIQAITGADSSIDPHLFMIAVVIFPVLPLCLLRDLRALRFTSLFAVMCYCYLAVVVVYLHFQMCATGTEQCFGDAFTTIKLFDFEPKHIFKTAPIVVFAFTCHPNLLPVYAVLQRPSLKRINKVSWRANMIACSIYGFVGLFALVTFGASVQSNFLFNDFQRNPLIIIGAAGVCISLLFTIPLYVWAARKEINQMVWKDDSPETMPMSRHLGITFLMLGGALSVALTTTDIAVPLSILGASINPMICYVIPVSCLCMTVPRNKNVGLKVVGVLYALLIIFASIGSLYYMNSENQTTNI